MRSQPTSVWLHSLAAALIAALTIVGCSTVSEDSATPASSPETPSPASTATSTRPHTPIEREGVHVPQPPGNVSNRRDPRRDVRAGSAHINSDADETDCCRLRPDPSERRADIIGLRVVTAAKRVFLRIQLAQLDPPYYRPEARFSHSYQYWVYAELQTDTDRFIVDLESGAYSTKGVFLFRSAGRRLECDDSRWMFDYTSDQVRIDLPRWCLDNPERVGATVLFTLYQYFPTPFTEVADHATLRGRT